MSEQVQTTVELYPTQLDYLDQMVQKHMLPNRDKALRCLIVFAMETASQNEDSIYQEVRCTNC